MGCATHLLPPGLGNQASTLQLCTLAQSRAKGMVRRVQVPMYVWERKCFACSGTGFVRSSSRSRRGRGTTGVCPTCIGLGAPRNAYCTCFEQNL